MSAIPPRLVFIIGAPRSGTTMLERILSSHSMVQGGPEPHLITPLAHLGVYDKVEKAPYDHILAAEAQKLFVSQLPNKEADYWEACRAYCDLLYGRFLQAKGNKPICLDKTPAYALVLPFLEHIYPDAGYIVLARHPLAVFSSFANSFFDGNYQIAHDYNPILERYVPAMANFLRSTLTTKIHIRYEDLVKGPELWFEKICAYLEIPFEPEAIEYGRTATDEAKGKGLGDPIGVNHHTRPTTTSVKKWVQELATDPLKLDLAKKMIAALSPDDLQIYGYPVASLWKPLADADKTIPIPKPPKLTRYRFERKLIINLRNAARRFTWFRKVLERIRLTCDVLLRE